MRQQRWLTVLMTAFVLISAAGLARATERESFRDRLESWRSQRTATRFVGESPTYAFDGIADSLTTTATARGDCDQCYTVTIEFQCANAGYGDRNDEVLLPVLTPHTATVYVKRHKVVEADLDGKWDMITQKAIAPPWEPTPEQLKSLVDGNTSFAFDLYQHLSPAPGNFFCSPYSISTAMAMAYAGARNETEAQLASVLHFRLPQNELHPTLKALGDMLDSRGWNASMVDDDAELQLKIADAAWGQADFDFYQNYLDVLEDYYSSLKRVDFINNSIEAVATVNDWVADQTEDRIQDILRPSDINWETLFILVNAIYFKAQWELEFDEKLTYKGIFNKLDGQTVSTPLMVSGTDNYGYLRGEGYEAVELPYDGERLSMVIVLPDNGSFKEVENLMNETFAASVFEGLLQKQVKITMPKFTLESEFRLKDALTTMGAPLAFDGINADFSGIGDISVVPIYLSEVIHKAFVAVDEQGTEATAATVVIGCGPTSVGYIEVVIDRPFIFMIRDIPTNTILFLGRVLAP